MALKSTVHRVELQISDLDRHYYASHSLTLAQHPSETDARLMVRLMAFAMYAQERLEFGRGLSADDEPDLWLKSLTGEIEHWFELGQPEEAALRRACGRARRVTLIGYSGRAFDIWWEKNAAALARCGNLDVIALPAGTAEALSGLLTRGMRLQCLVQEGELQLMSETATVSATPTVLQAATRG
ncbi:MAG: YaeQ family protein [Dechloromonas sp.]|jgi:uncharacterized protein YaeQ|nr:MAG: YaeQ family protein [Dechloromonas sp.]